MVQDPSLQQRLIMHAVSSPMLLRGHELKSDHHTHRKIHSKDITVRAQQKSIFLNMTRAFLFYELSLRYKIK
jgi:hypothetical protein